MSNHKRGDRHSQWEVFDRCYALLLRLMRGSAHSDELLQIVEGKIRENHESVSLSSTQKRFEEDRRRLRDWFYAEIEYDRREDSYTLTSIHRPLIDLPSDAARGLAFLQATFAPEGAVMSAEVLALINSARMLLSDQRRREIERERGVIEASLQPRDEDDIPDGVLDTLSRVCRQHQRMEFDYLASSNQDGIPRTHVVEPLRCLFDESRGHYYLQAFNLETRGPKGRHIHEEVRHYRVGRIKNLHILPNHFLDNNRRLPRYELIYTLTPRVARRGVTRHFPESIVYEQADGGAEIHAVSSDLFFDLRRLLHYGANCRVIGGDEAIKEMKAIVAALYQQYTED